MPSLPEEAAMLNLRLRTLILMILAAAGTRLLPHPPNVTSITALALFGGAHFADRRLAYALPLLALLLSDLVLGVYWSWSPMAYEPHMWLQYLCFALVVTLGLGLRQRPGVVRTVGTMLAGSTLFFVVSNFGVWVFQPLYPHTAAGLVACYVAAIPFFGNSLAGDAFYTLLMFGGFHLLETRFASLREPQPLRA
jgi:hypothetical protein